MYTDAEGFDEIVVRPGVRERHDILFRVPHGEDDEGSCASL